MMPDLGKYAAEVMAAYGASLGLIAVLVGFSLRRAARVRAALREMETQREKRGG